MANTEDADPAGATGAGPEPTGIGNAPAQATGEPHALAPRTAAPSPLRQEWREEFPYHWNADDLVTRRDTLRFLVGGSGALFLASATLAVTGAVRGTSVNHVVAIARVDELPVNGSKVFSYPDAFADGILVNLPDKGLVAYSDVCTHLSCAVLYQPAERRFFCPCHAGKFDAYTGQVLGGPPTRPLPIIELRVAGDTVYAVQEVER
jgi:nitrite reductase/ring-hydroxylating ferredoxin subunit